jgi:dTDP-L-rhamnose 4-epimerase
VRDPDAVARALEGIDTVFHEAAAVGVGQSMYDIRRYVEVNSLGAATVLESILAVRDRIGKLIVASSMSLYGEGAYRCRACGPVSPPLRSDAQLAARDWELHCPRCGATPLMAAPTSEEKLPLPTSIYAVTKRDHEEFFLSFGRAYGIPTVALRYFNVFGPRQALSNPYTGVAAIFSGRLLGGNPPVIFEDGRQSRDFVSVKDIVAANLLALECSEADGEMLNVGSGVPTTVLDVASQLIKLLRPEMEPQILGQFRAGDIRHCYADISRIRSLLGYEPSVSFTEGLPELVEWVDRQTVVDRFDEAHRALERAGLTH